MKREASKYVVESLRLEEKVLLTDKLPGFKSYQVPNHWRDWNINALERLIATNFGFKSLDELARFFLETEPVDHVAILIHINSYGRSFATSILELEKTFAERAIVYSKNEWNQSFDPYTYAHEIFHLFGADDLYDIKGAKGYYPRDIMHQRELTLSTNEVSPLTGYAVGWLQTKPRIEAFKIIELSSQQVKEDEVILGNKATSPPR